MDFEVEISSGLMTAFHVVVIDLLLAWLIATGVDNLLAAHQRQEWFDNGKLRSSVIWILRAGPFGDYAGTNSANIVRVGTAIAALILAVMTGLGMEGFSKQTWRTQEVVWIVLDGENAINYTMDDLIVYNGTSHPRRSQKNLLLSQYLSCWTSTEKDDIWTPAIIGDEGEFVRCLDTEEAQVNDVLKSWPRAVEIGAKITCSPTPTLGKSSDQMDIEEVELPAERGKVVDDYKNVFESDEASATEPPDSPAKTHCTWEGIESVEVKCHKKWCVGFGKNTDNFDIIVEGEEKKLLPAKRSGTSEVRELTSAVIPGLEINLQDTNKSFTELEELTSVVVPGLEMETLDSRRLLMFYLAGYDIGRSLQIVSMMASEKVRAKTKIGRKAATRVSSWYVPVVGGFFALAMVLRLVTFIVYRNPIDLRGMHDRLDISGIWSLYVNAETGGSKSYKKCEYKGIEIGWNVEEQHFGIAEDISQV